MAMRCGAVVGLLRHGAREAAARSVTTWTGAAAAPSSGEGALNSRGSFSYTADADAAFRDVTYRPGALGWSKIRTAVRHAADACAHEFS